MNTDDSPDIPHADFHDHARSILRIEYNEDITYILATASADKTARIYDCNTGETLQVLNEHTLGLNDCKWMSAEHLVTCSDDKSVKVWDIEMAKCVWTSSSNHKSFVYSLAVHRPTNIILSGGYDGAIRLLDIRAGGVCTGFDAHAEAITSIAIHPNGREFLTSSFDGLLRLWDCSSSASCMLSVNETTPIGCATYSPNGQYILTGNLDDSMTLKYLNSNIDCADGIVQDPQCKNVQRYHGHVNKKYGLQSCIYPELNNQSILSGSEDHKVYIWDAQGCDESNSSAVLEGHDDVVIAVACSPNPHVRQVASGCRDGSMRLWDVSLLDKSWMSRDVVDSEES